MRKRLNAAIAAMTMIVLLCACAPQETAPTIATTAPAPQTEAATETTAPAEDGARKAFQAALKTIHDQLVYPALPGSGAIEIFEPATIEDEQFAIADVDGDGAEELLVSISNTYMAGMCELVYGYDAAADSLRVEAEAFPGVTYYPGMMQVMASHNQGHAGDVLWPYTVMTYNEDGDLYEPAFFVDAWSRELSETDFEGNPYPEDIDVDGDGYVYLITENDETRTLNRTDFEKWESELFAGKEKISIPWQKMTAENIANP